MVPHLLTSRPCPERRRALRVQGSPRVSDYPATAIELLWRVVAQARWRHPTSGFVADVFSCYLGWQVLGVRKAANYLYVQVESDQVDEFRHALGGEVDKTQRTWQDRSTVIKVPIPES